MYKCTQKTNVTTTYEECDKPVEGGWIVKAGILLVTESLGKWIVVNFQLGDLGVLVGSDHHKLCIWDGNGDLWLTSRLKDNLHCTLVHSVEQYLFHKHKVIFIHTVGSSYLAVYWWIYINYNGLTFLPLKKTDCG